MTERSYQVIVAGGGASGMTAAILAARSGLRTAVLEANDMVGKKLLATGNGKCNFTNSRQLPDCYRGQGAETAMRLLERYDVHRVLSFFEELGIYPKQKNGYWYPNSGQAASVREALLEELLRCGADVITCCRVKSVRRIRDGLREPSRREDGEEPVRAAQFPHGPRFEITAGWREKKSTSGDEEFSCSGKQFSDAKSSSGKKPRVSGRKKKEKREKPQYSEERELLFEADYVVLACGGMAGSVSGADGSGYALAKGLGLDIVEPVPALVQLKAAEKTCGQLSGVRLEAAGELVLPGGGAVLERGEFLFTDYGISGIPAMQLSRFASVYLNRRSRPEKEAEKLPAYSFAKKEGGHAAAPGSPKLFLDFFPDTEENKLSAMLLERFRRFESRSAEKVLLGLLPAKLNYVLLCLAGITPEERFEMRRGGRGRPERDGSGAERGRMNHTGSGHTAGAEKDFRIEELAGLMKRFPLTIIGTNPFEAAQVTAGGICMDGLSQETLEAVRVPGLYVTGELADVDGTCGGYNLHWAWMSGMAAAESIIRNEGNGL